MPSGAKITQPEPLDGAITLSRQQLQLMQMSRTQAQLSKRLSQPRLKLQEEKGKKGVDL